LCCGQPTWQVKEAFPCIVADVVNAVTGVIGVILGQWVDARGRNRRWFWAGKVAGCMDM